MTAIEAQLVDAIRSMVAEEVRDCVPAEVGDIAELVDNVDDHENRLSACEDSCAYSELESQIEEIADDMMGVSDGDELRDAVDALKKMIRLDRRERRRSRWSYRLRKQWIRLRSVVRS